MPGNPLTDPNWASDLADTIDRHVSKVRSTVTDRAVYAVRAVVFGIVVLIAAPVAVALMVILTTKFVQRLIALATDHDSSVWSSYMVIGGLLVLCGSLAMRKRYGDDPA